jgi:hypothetical protein
MATAGGEGGFRRVRSGGARRVSRGDEERM